MNLIPEAIVEKTWQEFAGFTFNKAKRELMKVSKSQPDLLTFVTESTGEMSQGVRELTIYMLVVVYRMSQRPEGKIKKISSEEITECYGHNESLMGRLEVADEKFLDRIASAQTSRQPYVVNYVVDALVEEDEGEDALTLTDEQRGFLFLLFKTESDVLDRKG